MSLRFSNGPTSSARDQFVPDLRPVVQSCWIEVRSVWPDKRSNFLIERHGIEDGWILQWSEQRAVENRPEIDSLLRAILEAHFQSVGSNEPKSNDAVNGMLHGLLQWLDLEGWLTGLQEVSWPPASTNIRITIP